MFELTDDMYHAAIYRLDGKYEVTDVMFEAAIFTSKGKFIDIFPDCIKIEILSFEDMIKNHPYVIDAVDWHANYIVLTTPHSKNFYPIAIFCVQI